MKPSKPLCHSRRFPAENRVCYFGGIASIINDTLSDFCCEGKTMQTVTHFCLSMFFSIFSVGCVAIESAAVPLSRTEPTAPAHSRKKETAKIREHHLERLNNRLTIEPHLLRESCKYESEISTRPPNKRVVLTFDDGPEPGQTEYILEILKKYDITAAFFVIGSKAKQHPELIAQIKSAGHHTIGNHSWDHPNFHDINVAKQKDEVLKTDEWLANNQSSKLFRYPYGNSSCETNELLRSRGYRIVGWHIDSCDWAFDRDGDVGEKEALSCGVLAHNRRDFVNHVVSSVRGNGGGIVLLHEIHPNTLKQLDNIIIRLLREGFVFGAMEDDDFKSSLR